MPDTNIRTEHAAPSTTRPTLPPLVLALYYLAVLLALVVLYGRGDFSTSGFIYQRF